MRFNRRARRGFTLLEVLMAVGIFAFAAIGLLLALETTLDSAKDTQHDAQIRDGLANRLARVSVGPMRPVDVQEKENGANYRTVVGREEVTNAERTLLRGFWRIRVTAQWDSPSGPQTWTTSHLVYRNDG